jgi:hypothetical protein
MKKLSDYKNEDAIELWANILDPLMAIFQDEKFLNELGSGKPVFKLAALALKEHKAEVCEIVLAIDDTEITGLNLLPRTVEIFTEVKNSEEFAGFFGSTPQKKENASSGSAMANTEADGQ